MSASPFSLGVNTDFDVDPETKKAIDGLPVDMQEVAKRGLAAIKAGAVDPTDPRLSDLGHQALAQRAGVARAPAMDITAQGNAQGPYSPANPAPMPHAGPPVALQPQANADAIQAGVAGPVQPSRVDFNPWQPAPLMAPIAPHSGMKDTDTSTGDFQTKLENARKGAPEPGSIQDILQQLRDTPESQGAKENIKALEARAATLPQGGTPSGPLSGDLGGFLAMFSRPGQNLAEGYVSPQARAMAQQKQVSDLLEKIQTAKDSLSNNQAAVLRGTLGGQVGMQSTEGGKFTQGRSAQDPLMGPAAALSDRNERSLGTVVANGMKDLVNANASTKEAQGMLASNTGILDTTFRDKFIKSLIGGRVTNYDQMRQNGFQDLADRAEQLMQTLQSGNFSPTNKAGYEDALRVISEANSREAALRLKDFHDYGVTGLGLPEDRVQGALKLGHSASFHPVPAAELQASALKSASAVPEQVGATVRVKLSNGKVGTIPIGNLKALQAQDPGAVQQ